MKNMQLTTKLSKISELKDILSDNNSTNNILVDYYKMFAVKRIKTFFDSLKTKGISGIDVLFSLRISV